MRFPSPRVLSTKSNLENGEHKEGKKGRENMVDMILEEEELLIGMTAIKDYDEYTYHHSVNVSILL